MGRTVFAIVLALAAAPDSLKGDDWQSKIDQGKAAEVAGDYEKAAALYREGVGLAERFDVHDSRRVVSWFLLANMNEALGRYSDAESNYHRALVSAERSTGNPSASYATVLGSAGILYSEMGEFARAEKTVREALAMQLSCQPKDELRIAITRSSLADVLMVSRKFEEAAELYADSLTVVERQSAPFQTAITLNGLASVRASEKKYTEAEDLLRRSIAIIEERAGLEHPMLIRPLNDLAAVMFYQKRLDEAAVLVRRAVDIAETRLGLEHPMTGKTLLNYAGCLRRLGRKSEAKSAQALAERVLGETRSRSGAGLVVDVSALRGR